jgi:hypothetical protein
MLKALMLEFPHLDHLMAETLIRAYENGTLPEEEEEVHSVPTASPPPPLQNAIIVSDEPITIRETK